MSYLVGTTGWLDIVFPPLLVEGEEQVIEPTEPYMRIGDEVTNLTPYQVGVGRYRAPLIVPEGYGAVKVIISGQLDAWPVKTDVMVPRKQP